LQLGDPPRYTHLPLILGPDGHRLAKRHGDTRLLTYQQRGVTPQRIIGLLAWWCGASERREPMTASEFVNVFRLAQLPRYPMTFTEDDDAWLTRD